MTKQTIVLKIAQEFTPHIGARYRSDGDFSGDQFYEDILKPKLDEVWRDPKKKIILDLDGTFGYASSFLSQIFVRIMQDFHEKNKVLKKLIIKSDEEPLLIEAIKDELETTDSL